MSENEMQILTIENDKKNTNIDGQQRQPHTPLITQNGTKEVKPQWTKVLTFAGYASTLGSAVPAGYCIGVMNSPAVHMRSWCNTTLIQRYDYHLSATGMDILWSAIVSIFLIGGAVGSLSGAWAAKKFGRKCSFLLSGFFFLNGGILFYCCRLLHSVELLISARFLVGLASGLTTTCLPMYLSELAPLALRGSLGVFTGVGLTAGVVVAQICSLRSVLGSAEHWHMAMCFYAIFVVICYVPLNYYPESPKWLYIVKDNRELACKELRRLRGNMPAEVIAKEIEEMEIEANLKDQAASFGDVLKDPTLLLPLIIVCAFHGGQQLSGINAIFYYSVSIFRKAGLSATAAEYANLGAGSLNLVSSLFTPMLMAKINRRPSMMFSAISCAAALLIFALMLRFIETVPWFAVGCIACIFLYIFFFQFGLGPIPFFIGTEIFEIAPRPVAMSMGSLSSWSCNFIIGMTFPSLQNAWGALVFLPCSLTCFLIFLLTKFYLPETRGRDPPEVAPLISKGFKSKVH